MRYSLLLLSVSMTLFPTKKKKIEEKNLRWLGKSKQIIQQTKKNTVRADKIMPWEEFLNWYGTFLLQRSRYWSNLKSWWFSANQERTPPCLHNVFEWNRYQLTRILARFLNKNTRLVKAFFTTNRAKLCQLF